MSAVRPVALAVLCALAVPSHAADAPQTVQLQRVEVS